MAFQPDISLQLYSAREFPTWSDRIGELAGLGLKSVEPFGGLVEQPDELAEALAAHGMTAPSAHVGLDYARDHGPELAANARRLGIRHLFIPWLNPGDRPTDRQGWAALGRTVGDLAKRYHDLGFEMGWHNHDFEIAALADGSRPMDALLDAAPELTWECDIAWVAKAGDDPVTWLARYADRIRAVHVKDIAPAGQCADEGGWADVGHGTLDWPRIWAAARASKAEIFALEHDNPSDFSRFARRSLETIAKLVAGEAR